MLPKKLATFLTVALFVAGGAGAAEAPKATYSDPLYGFSLDVPELGDPDGGPVVQRVTFSSAPRDGFAVNCNVQLQFLEMEFPSYMDMSLKQFDAAGLEVVQNESREVSGREAAVLEYAGTMAEEELRFLALAVGGDDRFWLVTCTAQEERFDDHRPRFVELIESFEVQPAD